MVAEKHYVWDNQFSLKTDVKKCKKTNMEKRKKGGGYEGGQKGFLRGFAKGVRGGH
jgi:hypothetical protein